MGSESLNDFIAIQRIIQNKGLLSSRFILLMNYTDHLFNNCSFFKSAMILNSYEQLPILFYFCFESLKWITAHPEVEGIISLPENCEISNNRSSRLGMLSKKI